MVCRGGLAAGLPAVSTMFKAPLLDARMTCKTSQGGQCDLEVAGLKVGLPLGKGRRLLKLYRNRELSSTRWAVPAGVSVVQRPGLDPVNSGKGLPNRRSKHLRPCQEALQRDLREIRHSITK
jgi:hypothetical protein